MHPANSGAGGLGTQPLSSRSAWPAPSSPTQRWVRGFTRLQSWKWPISAANDTLIAFAVHGARVSSDEVEYMAWKSYGTTRQSREGFGAKTTCAKPLAALAVIDPDSCVVRSSS